MNWLRSLKDGFGRLAPMWRAGSILAAVAVVALVVVVIASAGGSHPRSRTTASVPTASPVASPTNTTSAGAGGSGKKAHHAHKHAAANGSGHGAGSASGSSSGGSGGGSAGHNGGASGNCSTGATSGSGQIVMYGNAPEPLFKPVIDAFNKTYPKISINYSDVDDNVAFSKYRAEHAQGARTADIVMESSPLQWDNNTDIALCWKPSDTSAYPSWFEQFPGILIAAPDPAVSIYSKVKFPPNLVPNTFARLLSDLKSHPDLFKGKTTTYSISNQFGYSAFWGLVNQHGWSWLNALGPASKPQPDGTAMAQQIVTGASNYGFFEAGLVRGALTGTVGQVVGWTYMHDFTPLIPRGIAITKGAANPAAAKVFLNWMFSTAGQQAMCAAGFTAFKSGVSCANSLAAIQAAVGASNVFLVPFHSSIAADYTAFSQRWHHLFG